jgi:hypothetical protein
MGLTLVEKIAARHADGLVPGTQVRSGDFVSIVRATYDVPITPRGEKLTDRRDLDCRSAQLFAIDHDIKILRRKLASTRKSKRSLANTESILSRGTGISHQVMVEQATSFRL